MARGKSKKVGLQRIDAAYDALLPLGFSKKVVKTTIDRLLKEIYGGSQGWTFIEEANYQVVIDTILEEQQAEGEDIGDHSKALEISDQIVEACLVQDGLPSGEENIALISGEEEKQPIAFPSTCVSMELPFESSHASPSRPQPSEQSYTASTISLRPSDQSYTASPISLQPSEQLTGASHSVIQQPMNPVTRRPPCYGWISESEDEDDGAPVMHL